MKTFVKLLIVLIITFTGVVAYSFDGPLQVKNQYPIFLHADQPYLESALMESSFSVSLSHSSTYTVQDSRDWIINQDMEISELNLRYKRIVYDFIEVGIDLPVLAFSGGFMDGFLKSYHDTFGLPDYGRSARPDNEFLYEIRKDGRLVIKGKTGVGLGDIRLTVKRSLISSDDMGLSVTGNIELPTGDAKSGYGNGSIDAGIAVILDKRIAETFMTYWNLGAVFTGDLKGHEELGLKDFIYGGLAIETILKEKFGLVAQLQGQSSIYPKTDLLAVDREAWLLSFGGRYDAGSRLFELSFTEDINSSGAPDFIMNLTYKVKL